MSIAFWKFKKAVAKTDAGIWLESSGSKVKENFYEFH